MFIGGAISGTVRALLIAAATGAAVLGLLVVLHRFESVRPAPALAGGPAADTLRAKIADARDALARTEASLDAANGAPASIGTPQAGTDAQLEAQIAAAIERRDLALRHAQAIRAALQSGADLGSLAEVRDSVVIGQLLTQRAALDAQIAQQGARLKPNHPTMRALNAQKAALAGQVRAEAAGIATALEAEAKLDDAQLKQLQSQLGAPPTTAAAPDAGTLAAQANAQRAQLDGLVDSYFDLAPKAIGASGSPANILSPLNLFVAAIAAIAAAMFQLGLTLRRRRLRRQAAADLARWQRDHALGLEHIGGRALVAGLGTGYQHQASDFDFILALDGQSDLAAHPDLSVLVMSADEAEAWDAAEHTGTINFVIALDAPPAARPRIAAVAQHEPVLAAG